MQEAKISNAPQAQLPTALQRQLYDDGVAAESSAWTDDSAQNGPVDCPADWLLRKARLRFNDWLLEAATPAAVLRLVSQHGEAFNAVNVATALYRLARLVRGQACNLPADAC